MTYPVTFHRTAKVAGLDIFYREAGERGAPVVVLLHGFPSSSHMYRNLIPALADRFHVIAPDLPGFGLCGMPSAEDFNYSFESFSNIVASFLDQLTIKRYALYVMDYGAPTGLRVAVAHPGCVTALIVQNGNAYEDGIGDFWEPSRAYWAEPEAMRDAMRPFLTLEGTRFQYLTGTTDPKRIDPAAWLTDQLFLDRPGSTDIQLDIVYDYRTNVALYPKFHSYFREYRPPVLILWGEKDPIFLPDGARAFLRDLPDAELHFFDTGHFALEEKADEMIPILHDFLTRTLAS